jgi:4-hydroxy-tetrahydrodipicolinate reductase
VGVLGAKGRMGSESVQAISNAQDMECVAALDIGDELSTLLEKKVDVVVDFTTPDSVLDNLKFLLTNKIHAVVGTTGFDKNRLKEVEELANSHKPVGVLIAPNFGLGAVMAMRFAKLAAPHFESAEIIELHHPAKVDAPSGTAMATAEIIAQARKAAGLGPMPDATTKEIAGSRGASVEGVHVHALRLRGLVAHQEIIFGDQGETLTIRHDSIDRSGFMPGVLLGIRKVISHPGLTFGLDKYLFLD